MHNKTVATVLSLILILGIGWASQGTVTVQPQPGVRLHPEDVKFETPPMPEVDADDVLLSENFDGAWGPYGNNPPPGWTIIANGGDGVWNYNDWSRYYYSASYRAWIYWYPYDTGEDILMSPVINCGTYYNVKLNCWTYASYYGGGYDWKIWGSTDGGSTWPYVIRDYGSSSYGPGNESFNLTWATGQPNVRIRWRGYGYIYNINYWMVDNVQVTGDLVLANDVAVTKIISPPAKPYWAWGDTLYPICEVTNYGTNPQPSIPVRCRMWDTLTHSIAYDEVQTVGPLNPMEKCTVYFTPFLPTPLEEHFYVDTMRTELFGDQMPSNDAMVMTHKVTEWGSVWMVNHDGGFENAISWVSANGEWAAAFRQTPFPGLGIKQVGVWISGWGTYSYAARMHIYGWQGSAPNAGNPKSDPVASLDCNVISAYWPSIQRNVFDLECVCPDSPVVCSYQQLSVSPSYPYCGMDYNEPIDDNDAWCRHPSYTGNTWYTVRGYAGYHVDMSPEAAYAGRLIDAELAGFPFPDTLDSNTVIDFMVKIRNAGLVPRPNGIGYKVWFIHDEGGTGYTPGETLFSWEGNTGPINAGETKNIPLGTSWNAKPGKYHFYAYTTLLYDKGYENDTCDQSLFIRYRDVQVTIVRPQPIEPAGSIPVTVKLTNLGNVPAYPQRIDVQIPPDYSDFKISGFTPIPVGGYQTFSFMPWVASNGIYEAKAWYQWDLDMFPDNDEHLVPVIVGEPDIGVTAILSPAGTVDPYNPVTPKARIKNFGDIEVPFTAYFTIHDMTDALVYLDSVPGSLAPGAEEIFSFPDWLGPRNIGPHTAKCSVDLADLDLGNNVKTMGFLVSTYTPELGWKEMKSIPGPVKDGGWLAMDYDNLLIYAARGYKSGDFYVYNPETDEWTACAPWPSGMEGKLPAKGAVGCYGNGYIYATKGNNTSGFWRYSIAENKWEQLQDVPAGTSGKRVKGGTDLAYVVIGDVGYVYLLKGYRCDFMRFNTSTMMWEGLPDAPTGLKAKWDKGSWLAYDGENTIYAHKAKYQELYPFDITAGAWGAPLPSGMPRPSLRTGKTKKTGDGGAAASYQGYIYALKGNNTCELWRFYTGDKSWYELPPMPDIGAAGRRKRVKSGGDIVSYGGWVFFFLKGNKTAEFWRYVDSTPTLLAGFQPERSGVMAEKVNATRFGFTLAPNPLVKGYGMLSYSVPQTGEATLTVYDVTGRSVAHFSFVASGTGTRSLDLRQLSAGVYLVKFSSAGQSASQKLIVR